MSTTPSDQQQAPQGTRRSRAVRRMVAYVRELRSTRRALGWRGLLRERGWRLVLLIVAVYLVRDLVLYVLIPLALVVGLTR